MSGEKQLSKRTDISQQIKKYLNGELDARAMHQLEKEAQNDPFLMEALEGYEQTGIDQHKNLDDIKARLNNRIDKPKHRIVMWRTISIAASVIIALTIGGLWIRNYQPDTRLKRITRTDKPKIVQPGFKTKVPDNNIAAIKPQPKIVVRKRSHAKNTVQTNLLAGQIVVAKPSAPENRTTSSPKLAEVIIKPKPVMAAAIAKDTTPLNEVVVLGYVGQKRKSVKQSTAIIASAQIEDKELTPGKTTGSTTNLQGKVTGVFIDPANTKVIKGVVKDETGPIPGVTVKVKGTDIITQTDAAGRFTVPANPGNVLLDLASIGYMVKEVRVAHPVDSIVIAMQPSSNSLNEVVTTGYGIKKEEEYQSAHPATGWNVFKKYLKDNAESPDGKIGTVKLSFMVNADNSLSDFKIIKSLGAQTDSAAVGLIKDGPAWMRNSDRKAEKIKVKVKFGAK